MPEMTFDEGPPLPSYAYATLQDLRASGVHEDIIAGDIEERMIAVLSSIYPLHSESVIIGTEYLGPVMVPHVALLPPEKDIPYTLHISQDIPGPEQSIHAPGGFQYHLADIGLALYVDNPHNPFHPKFDQGAVAAHTYDSSGDPYEDAQHIQMVFGGNIRPDVTIDIVERDQTGVRILLPQTTEPHTIFGHPIRGLFLPSPQPSKELHEPKLAGPVLFVVDRMSSPKFELP